MVQTGLSYLVISALLLSFLYDDSAWDFQTAVTMWTLCAYNLDGQFSLTYFSFSEKTFSQLKSMNMAGWYSGRKRGLLWGEWGMLWKHLLQFILKSSEELIKQTNMTLRIITAIQLLIFQPTIDKINIFSTTNFTLLLQNKKNRETPSSYKSSEFYYYYYYLNI